MARPALGLESSKDDHGKVVSALPVQILSLWTISSEWIVNNFCEKNL